MLHFKGILDGLERRLVAITIVTLITVLCTPVAPSADQMKVPSEAPILTHGPMVGAVTDSSAKIWFRVERGTRVQVEYTDNPDFEDISFLSKVVRTKKQQDYTNTVSLSGLAEDTTYFYRLLIDGELVISPSTTSFKTFPKAATTAKVGILTDIKTSATKPAPAMEALSIEEPDVVLVLGDWDHRNVNTLKEMRAMHRETRGDEKVSGAQFRDHILSKYPVAHVWDDHDYAKNNSDKTFTHKDKAIKAYDEYWPSYRRPNPEAGIWHKFAYADLVEMFMLDLRSQRDLNTYKDPRYIPDDQPGANRDELRDDPERSMLDGDALPEGDPQGQKQWLKDGLLNSTATWKIIASSVPWNPTTPKDDAWWDFRAEQQELLEFIRTNDITGVIVVSGDIHTGGAIDDGTNAGVAEMNVPTVNNGGIDTSCRLHKPRNELLGCGDWSHGFQADSTGYGLITLTTDSALIEAKDDTGVVVFNLSLSK